MIVSPSDRRAQETDGRITRAFADQKPTPALPALRGVRPVALLAGVLMTVGALYLGRGFLLPVVVAGLLTFVLNPMVRFFERQLPRAVAVLLVVVLTFSVLGALSWALAVQGASLGGQIPVYRDNLKRKIAEVRGASRGTVIEKVQSATKEVVEELQKEEHTVQGCPEARAGRGEAAGLHLLAARGHGGAGKRRSGVGPSDLHAPGATAAA